MDRLLRPSAWPVTSSTPTKVRSTGVKNRSPIRLPDVRDWGSRSAVSLSYCRGRAPSPQTAGESVAIQSTRIRGDSYESWWRGMLGRCRASYVARGRRSPYRGRQPDPHHRPSPVGPGRESTRPGWFSPVSKGSNQGRPRFHRVLRSKHCRRSGSGQPFARRPTRPAVPTASLSWGVHVGTSGAPHRGPDGL